MFYPADGLRHGTHGAVNTPGTGFPKQEGKDPQYGGSHHDAVETEGELRDPGRSIAAVSPVPGKFERPQ